MRHRCADARGNARNRVLQPPLRGRRRRLPDRTIVTKLDTDLPETTQVTFILSGSRLITNRYTDPLPFRRFISHAERIGRPALRSTVLAGLLEAIVNRIADVIERVGADIDAIRCRSFRAPPGRRSGRDYQARAGADRSERRARLQGAREPGQPRRAARLRAAGHLRSIPAHDAHAGFAPCRATSLP